MRFSRHSVVLGLSVLIAYLMPSAALASTRVGLIPTFAAQVSTSDGFKVKIDNFNSAYTFTPTVTVGKVTKGITSGQQRLLIITGLTGGQSAVVMVAVTRKGYPTKFGTVTGSAKSVAMLIPTYSTPISTAAGFTVNLTNYDPYFTFTSVVSIGTVTAGTASGLLLPLTVTGLTAGQSATLTTKVARTGYANGIATVTGLAVMGIWKTVSVAGGTTCAVTTDGAAYCWGVNSNGHLWNGSSTNSSVPVLLTGLYSGASISAGGGNTCTVTTSGAAYCWHYQSTRKYGMEHNSSVPVAVTGLSSGVASISIGGYGNMCAVTTAGGAYCWGYNYNGQSGNGSRAYSLVPVVVTGLSSGVASISAGFDNACAVTTSGAAYCWGDNSNGQLGNSSTTNSLVPVVVTGLSSGVASISASRNDTCAVTTSGAAYCWGDNSNGQLGNGSTTNSLVPVAVTGLSSGVASISAGNGLTCAVTTSGAAYCWGWNGEGDLGIGSTTGSLVPVAVTGLSSGVASISAGFLHTCAVTTSGAIYCWGHNSNGELGNGSTTKSMVPVLSTDLLGESFTSPVKADWVGNFKQPVASYVGVTSCKTIPGGREVTYRFNLTGGSFVTPDGTGFKAVGEGETYAYDDQVSEFYSSENLATSDVYNAYIGFEINRLPSNVSELKSYFGKWDKTRPMSYFTPVAVQTKDLCQIGVGTQSSGHDHFQLIYLSGTSSGADLSQAIQHEAMVVDKWFADQLSGRSPNYGGSIPPVISIHNDSDLSAALNGNEGAVIDSWRKSGLLGPTAEPVIYADGYAPRSDRACGWSTYGVGIMIPMVNCNRYPKPASVWLDGATYLLAHETTHSLGFTDHVQDDSRDVLYNGPVSGWGGQILLDPNHHHYLNTGDETSLEILDSPLLSGVYGK